MDSQVANHWIEILICTVAAMAFWYVRTQIAALWVKHDEDAKKLEDLQRHVDKEHYIKSELDNKFDRLESTMKAGMDKLSHQFEILSDVLTQHVLREDAREDARDKRERERREEGR